MPEQQTDFLLETPEPRVSNDDLQGIFAIISLLLDNLSGKNFVTCIHRSWITDDNILPFISSGRMGTFGLFNSSV